MSAEDLKEVMSIFPIKLDNGYSEDVSVHYLLEQDKCLEFLTFQQSDLKAPNLEVAASIFLKRYAYLTVSSTLYSMVENNAALDLSMKDCKYTKERSLAVKEWTYSTPHSIGLERDEWRKEVMKNLFSEQLTPIIQMLTNITRLPENIAWENVASRVNSIYRKLLAGDPSSTQKEWIFSDFYYLRKTDGKLFNLSNNPLQEYLKIEDEYLQHPWRSTCCMYYRLKKDSCDRTYCEICPLKKARNNKK